jgi:hypothetical protein
MFLENQIALHRAVAEWAASCVSGTRKGVLATDPSTDHTRIRCRRVSGEAGHDRQPRRHPAHSEDGLADDGVRGTERPTVSAGAALASADPPMTDMAAPVRCSTR